MDKKIYTVYDSKAETYSPPLLLEAVGAAVRSFENSVNGKVEAMTNNPEDFSLFELGSFCLRTGKFELHAQPFHIANGHECVKKPATPVAA